MICTYPSLPASESRSCHAWGISSQLETKTSSAIIDDRGVTAEDNTLSSKGPKVLYCPLDRDRHAITASNEEVADGFPSPGPEVRAERLETAKDRWLRSLHLSEISECFLLPVT
jgi:hypothetical protein